MIAVARAAILYFLPAMIMSAVDYPMTCHANASKKRTGEVRIVILPSRSIAQEHASVRSFKGTASHAELASAFQAINDPGLSGERYLAKDIPSGEYAVRISIGKDKADIVRIVRIEGPSETLYFGTDVTTAHIVVVDPLGDILKNIVIDEVTDEFGTDYAGAFVKGSSAVIPFGIYQLRAHADGYGVATGNSCFCQSESWAVLGVAVPGGDTVFPDASVRLKGNIQTGEAIHEAIIVRVSPAYLPSSMSSVILPGSSGKFVLSGALPEAGDYTLLVTQSGHILGNGTFRLPLKNAVSFKLETGAIISLESDRR